MRSLEELIDLTDPAMPLIREWAQRAVRPVEVLPPSDARVSVLLRTQVSTHTPMGAVAYETGGILIDQGWIRILGSGHPRLNRTLPDWNKGRSDDFYLVADDAVGGFFAWNGGALAKARDGMFYLAPDTLDWMDMEGMGYSQFLEWACMGKVGEFYANLRWQGWEQEAAKLAGDLCFFFYPPLFTKEGAGCRGERSVVPVAEAWVFNQDMRRQLKDPGEPQRFRIRDPRAGWDRT